MKKEKQKYLTHPFHNNGQTIQIYVDVSKKKIMLTSLARQAHFYCANNNNNSQIHEGHIKKEYTVQPLRLIFTLISVHHSQIKKFFAPE